MAGNERSGNRSPNRAKVGRPPQSRRLHIGDRVSVQHRSDGAVMPLEPGAVTELGRDGVTITLDNGDAIKVFV